MVTAAPSLAQFLRTRLAEDQQAAQLCPPLDQWWTDSLDPGKAEDARMFVDHISPARLIREVNAKRRIVELHGGRHECPSRAAPNGSDRVGCQTLRLLALAYAAHGDYRSEWAP